MIRTAIAAGIEVCLVNPGTTEMPLVLAMDSVPGIRAIPGLFEECEPEPRTATPAWPASPPLRSFTWGPVLPTPSRTFTTRAAPAPPFVNLIGDHATWHLDADAPLTSDIVSLAVYAVEN